MYLLMKDLRLDRLSRKLTERVVRPFKILKKEGNSFRLDLLTKLKDIYPVFTAEKLRVATKLLPLEG